jgi:hypothetical protein
MMQEMAETLLMCPLVLTEQTLNCRIEDQLYYLVGCGNESLQKAAFVLLKFIYENMFVPVEFVTDEAADIKQLTQVEEVKEEDNKYNFKSTAFKNISENLIRIIGDAPPTIDESENAQVQAYSG